MQGALLVGAAMHVLAVLGATPQVLRDIAENRVAVSFTAANVDVCPPVPDRVEVRLDLGHCRVAVDNTPLPQCPLTAYVYVQTRTAVSVSSIDLRDNEGNAFSLSLHCTRLEPPSYRFLWLVDGGQVRDHIRYDDPSYWLDCSATLEMSDGPHVVSARGISARTLPHSAYGYDVPFYPGVKLVVYLLVVVVFIYGLQRMLRGNGSSETDRLQ